MEFLAVAALVSTVLGFRYWQGLSAHQREWVAIFKGRRLRLIASGAQCVLEVDAEPAIQGRISHRMRPVTLTMGVRFRQCFQYNIQTTAASLGGADVQISSEGWHHSNKAEVSMSIDGQEVSLLGVDIAAGSTAEAIFTFLDQGESAAAEEDSRLLGARRILAQVRESAGGDTLVVEATQLLSRQLQPRFAMLAELTGPEADQVWSDQDQRAGLVEALEAEIALCLSAVENLHQHSITRRQAALNASDLSVVHEALAKLQASDEVEQTGSNQQQALLRRLAARQQQR